MMSDYKTPLVSIIILNYNGLRLGHLRTVLDSVLSTNYPNFEIILVDNGSSDESVEYVMRNYKNVKIIKLRKNYGSSMGYMVGALHAKGKYIAILNNDVEVHPNWLNPLVDYLEKNPYIAAADPKFKSYFHRDRFEDSAAAGRWIDYFGNNYTRGVNEIDYGQYDKPVYIMGVLTFFRKDILIRSGGFDPYFIFGYEDIDLGWRLYLMGYKVLYVPYSVIYHKSGGTTRDSVKRLSPGFYYLAKRNRLIALFKNYSILNMFFAIFATLLEYMALITYFMYRNEKEYARSVVIAVYRFFRNLRSIAKRRVRVQSLKAVSDRYVRKYMVPYCGVIWYINRKERRVK